jgi:phosphate starvation-inducible PhoH-like protein
MSRPKKSKKPKNRKPANNGTIQNQIQNQPREIKQAKQLKPKTKNQAEFIRTISENTVSMGVGPAGCGKTLIAVAYGIEKLLMGDYKSLIITRPVVEAGNSMGYLPGCQPLSQPLLTPKGWTTMGEIKIGDKVVGRDGMPTEVIGIYPKGEKDTYKVTTFDGTSTVCCADHFWYTQTKEEKTKKQQGKIRITKNIISDLKNGIKHFIPRNEAVHFDKKHLPIPPYTLGVMLGDGCIHSTHVRFASADPEISDRVDSEIKSLGLFCQKAKKQYSKACTYTISSLEGRREGSRPVKITEVNTQDIRYFPGNKQALAFVGCKRSTLSTRVFYGATVDGFKYEKYGESWKNPILKFFKESGLYNKKAWDKFVPNDYKYSSVQDRIDILRGLLDTDGSCRERLKDQVNFYTTSMKLAEDVMEIVRSLGGKARLRSRDRREEKINNSIRARRISHEVSISMPEDINPFYLKRKAERFKGKNVANIEITSIEKVGHEKVQCIMVENPEHLYLTDNFIVTHNTFAEKLDPYLQPIYYELSKYISKQELQVFINNGINRVGKNEIIIAPLAYMRGMNYHNSYMILDECQNCTHSQIKLFVTRVGFSSKAVLVGDDRQTDLYEGESGLPYWYDKLTGIESVGTFRFDNSDIIRNPVISRILAKIGE